MFHYCSSVFCGRVRELFGYLARPPYRRFPTSDIDKLSAEDLDHPGLVMCNLNLQAPNGALLIISGLKLELGNIYPGEWLNAYSASVDATYYLGPDV